MNKKYSSCIAHFAAAWLFCASPILAQIDVDVVAESIVQVRAYDDHKVVVEGSGFVVSEEGHVLTNAHFIEKAEGLTVLSLKTGAELVAQRVFASRDLNLALLHVQGLNLPPLSLSEQGATVGRVVQTLRFNAAGNVYLSHGTIGTYQDVPGKQASRPVVHLLQHNALITAQSFGMPVFNECGNVVALNMPDPSGSWPFRKTKIKGTMFALRSGDIIATLEDRKIAHTVVDEECLSAVERAERAQQAAADSLAMAKAKADSASKAAEKAQAQADSASKAAEKAKTQEEVARQMAEQAQARADSAEKAVADSLKASKTTADSLKIAKARADSASKATADSLKVTKATADSLKAVEAKAQAQADSLRAVEAKAAQRLQWGIAAGAGLVLLALLGWWLSARRKKGQLQSAEARLSEAEQTAEAARQAAANAPQPAPFRCLLEGRDSTGRPFALTISALALGERSGVTLGRSPANAEFIIDHQEVSREHVRLTCVDGELYAEDLNALNGTKVNGRLLNTREQVLLQNKDQLEIGSVVFTVRLVQE